MLNKPRKLTWIVDEDTGCFIVTSHKTDSDGYVRISHNKRLIRAHRWAYEQKYGKLPDDVCVCHSCDRRNCVNPDHLWIGTNSDNTHDMVKKGRNINLKGEDHGMAKLLESRVRFCREHTEISGKEMALMLKISESSVSLIRSKKRWQHLP